MNSFTGQVGLVHIDCDLYSSIKFVLDSLVPLMKSGTLIQFDEFYNFWGWENHEYLAFTEFLDEHSFGAKFIGFTDRRALVELITKTGK